MAISRAKLLAGVCTFAALGWAGHAAAQATTPKPGSPPAAGRQLSEVVVTAAPFAVSAESLTSHVDIVTRAQLDVAPATGLGDLLNGLPGVRSSAYTPGASRPIIRGASGPRVLVLQNGIGQIDVSDVSPDHAVASDPSEASRIEILRGPSTILYGGSGIGGVVNVIDDRIASAKVDGLHGRFNASGSTVDTGYNIGGDLKLGYGNWVVSLVGDHREASDYDIPVPALSKRYQAANGVASQPDLTLKNTYSDFSQIGGGVSYVGDWGFLGVSVRQLDSAYGVPYPQILGQSLADADPVHLDLSQTRVDVRGEVKLPETWLFEKAKLSGGWADYTHSEISNLSGDVNTTFLSTGGEGRLELVQRDRGGWQGAVGVNGLARSFAAVGDEAFVPPTDIARVGVFTLQRYDAGRWGLEGGLRLDYAGLSTTADARFPILIAALKGAKTASRDFEDVSASVAAFVRPAANWFASLNFAHNARAPNEVELFANGPHGGTEAFEVGDPNLGSETVNSVEGTLRYTGDRFRAEGHIYYASFSDYIEERNTGRFDPVEGLPIYRFTPLGAEFYGAELEGSYALWRSGAKTLKVEAAYDYVHAQGDDGPLARIPPYSVTGRLHYSDSRFEGRIEVRRVGEQDRTTAFELPTDAYATLDTFASYKPIADKAFRVYVDARNLTDEEVREHASFLKDIAPSPGRNLRFGISYAF